MSRGPPTASDAGSPAKHGCKKKPGSHRRALNRSTPRTRSLRKEFPRLRSLFAAFAPFCSKPVGPLVKPPLMRLILASASPRRRELLDRVGLAHSVAPAVVTEHEDPDSCPDAMVRHNAEIKARAVA